MYSTEGRQEKACPVCGRVNNRQEDQVRAASSAGF
jgi:hypothetical protein